MLERLQFFFFFQAEDGIRDYKVTGVQTCALPISRRGFHDETLQPCIGNEVEQRRRGDEIDRPVERRFEVPDQVERFRAYRHSTGRIETSGPLQQSEIIVDTMPVLRDPQARGDRAQGRPGAAAEIDDANRAQPRDGGGQRVENRGVSRALIVRFACRKPAGRERLHDTPSITRTNTAAAAAQVGSRFAAARALRASRARSPASEISSRNAAASAGTSSGGTRSPAPAGTVSGIAPAVVPITGTP